MPVDLEQLRAKAAFRAALAALNGGGGDDFLGQARRLPVLLRTNGLLASWAYLKAKEREVAVIRGALREHLRERHPEHLAKVDVLFEQDDAPEPENRLSAMELQALTTEALAFAGWLKRAAEGVCSTGSGDAQETTGDDSHEGSQGPDAGEG
ncbi:MAG: type III-B CRISPR module-associated protein Cmr5 [bacterium]